MKTKTLHQTVKFKASPTQVYEMLMDSRKHRSLSGMPAKISRKFGGTHLPLLDALDHFDCAEFL